MLRTNVLTRGLNMARPQKYSFETVEAVRHARLVERRSVAWIAERFEIPIDTVRDWLYRRARKQA